MARSNFRQWSFALLLAILTFIGLVAADRPGYVTATIDGQQYLVRDNRRPSLYTANYGDCMGGSSINVTRFDAAYYKDNMTVLFHLGGETALKNESIMSKFSFHPIPNIHSTIYQFYLCLANSEQCILECTLMARLDST